MERWEYLVDQLDETGALSEARAEVKTRKEILDQSWTEIKDARGTAYDTSLTLHNRAEKHIAKLRDGLRLHGVYFEGSGDVRPGDTIWVIPAEWRETNHQFMIGPEVVVTIWELPDGRYAQTHRQATGPVEDQAYEVQEVGNEYQITPVSIDWDEFEDAFPIGVTTDFREFVEERYQRAVESRVRAWIQGEFEAVERDLSYDPLSLELAESTLVEWIIDWENIPKPEWDTTLEDRDREHRGYVINHALRYVDTKGFSDAIYSFPNVVQDALEKSTPGRYLWGFQFELTDDQPIPARVALEKEKE
jgi:hypothetical protein